MYFENSFIVHVSCKDLCQLSRLPLPLCHHLTQQCLKNCKIFKLITNLISLRPSSAQQRNPQRRFVVGLLTPKICLQNSNALVLSNLDTRIHIFLFQKLSKHQHNRLELAVQLHQKASVQLPPGYP